MTAVSSAATDERPWHLSEAHLPAQGDGPIDEADESDATPEPTGAPTELAPLWYRIVTGKSLGWRVRRVRNRIRWARRGSARRTLRWFLAHPEISEAARAGESRELLAALIRRRRNRGTQPSSTFRARVAVAADVTLDLAGDVTGDPVARLFVDGVDLHHDGTTDVPASGSTGPALTVTSTDGGLLTTSGPAGQVGPLLAPVDLRRWNPSRFWARPTSAPVQLGQLPLGDDERVVRRRLAVAHRSRAVQCDTESGSASGSASGFTPEVTARTIVELASAGVPLVGHLPGTIVDLIGPQLGGLIGGVGLADLDDDVVRELHALCIRRAALDRHSPRGWWGSVGERVGVDVHTAPSISVLLPSNRPDDVLDAARRVADQVGVDVQLVVGLHGSHMPASLDDGLAAAFGGDLVIRRLADDLNLGQVMNDLTAFADGDLVSKWDDDDWYDPHHLADLAWAMEYSGASMVGKAAEFVYLETLDLTIRRFATGCERMSTTVAGGTLMLTRDDLTGIGWANVPRQVDRQLIDALEARGLATYRTHGFGYVLRRRSEAMAQHTWIAGDEYFLRQASDQRPGLDLAFAGFHTADGLTVVGA